MIQIDFKKFDLKLWIVKSKSIHKNMHRDPDPVFKIPNPDPDPARIWPKIEKCQIFFVILFPSKLIQDFYSKIILYKNKILPYYTFLAQKVFSQNI